MSGAEPFVFIVGCGRSGTTLLTALMDSHPAMAVPGESGGFILRFCRRTNGEPQLTEWYEELEKEHRFRRWGLDAEEVLGAALERGVKDRPGFIRSAYMSFAEAHGKRRIADKTPDHVLHMTELLGWFPEARFVHLVRDGRDVALAMRDTGWAPKRVGEAARHWALRVNAGRRTGQILGAGRYLELAYEDLVSEPERVLRKVCSFAQLDYDDGMLDHSAAAGRQIVMSPDPHEDRSLGLPVTAGLRDWRTQMSPEDAATFADIAGDALADFGYDVPAPTATA